MSEKIIFLIVEPAALLAIVIVQVSFVFVENVTIEVYFCFHTKVTYCTKVLPWSGVNVIYVVVIWKNYQSELITGGNFTKKYQKHTFTNEISESSLKISMENLEKLRRHPEEGFIMSELSEILFILVGI